MFTVICSSGWGLDDAHCYIKYYIGEMVSFEEPEDITDSHILQRVPGWLNLYDNSLQLYH